MRLTTCMNVTPPVTQTADACAAADLRTARGIQGAGLRAKLRSGSTYAEGVTPNLGPTRPRRAPLVAQPGYVRPKGRPRP